MTIQQRRNAILNKAYENGGTITKHEAVELLKNCYYANASHYVGPILATLVNRGQLERVKPGVFKLGRNAGNNGKVVDVIPNQLNLF